MHPRWKVTMERYLQVLVALSESVIKNLLKRSLAEKSRWRHICLAIKPRYLGSHASQIKIYYGTLSVSRGRSSRIRHKNPLKCSLAEKSRWRHIRLSIKPRYLGNHASHTKSWYGALSVSHGRFFRIRNKRLPEAPPGGEITITWCLTCNKNS